MADGQLAPGVLPRQEILRLCDIQEGAADDYQTETGPIRPCLKSNVRTASYDLRLGREFYVGKARSRSHQVRTEMLPERGGTLVIEPNSVVVVTALETLNLSRDMIGRLSLKMDLLRLGLIMAAQSQIDAGYRGRIFALLYNLSNERRSLQHGQSIIRVELDRLPEESTDYEGDYEDKTLAEILEAPLVSSLEETHRTVREMERRIRNTRIGGIIAGAIAILALIASFVIFFLGEFNDLSQDVARLERSSPEQGAPATTLSK